MAIKAALLGFGTVGTGVYETIMTHHEDIRKMLGEEIEVVAVLVKDKDKSRSVENTVHITTDFEDILSISDLDVAVEAIVGQEPANQYMTALLDKGIHVVSANKECIAYKGKELRNTAEQNGVTFSYEAAVAGGIPVIRTIRELLRVNRIEKIEGILNGTSNFILSDMRNRGVSFTASLADAQYRGFAEADPTNDIEGWDAFYKLMILSDLVFGEQPAWDTVERSGITGVSEEDIRMVESAGERIKLVASIQRRELGIEASVKPVVLDAKHPLYAVEGVNNAVRIHADIVGDLLLQGPGAGSLPTASAIIEDIVNVLRERAKGSRSLQTVQ